MAIVDWDRHERRESVCARRAVFALLSVFAVLAGNELLYEVGCGGLECANRSVGLVVWIAACLLPLACAATVWCCTDWFGAGWQLVLVPLTLVGLLMALLAPLGRCIDYGDRDDRSLVFDGGTVAVRPFGNATTRNGILIRREVDVLPGVVWARVLLRRFGDDVALEPVR